MPGASLCKSTSFVLGVDILSYAVELDMNRVRPEGAALSIKFHARRKQDRADDERLCILMQRQSRKPAFALFWLTASLRAKKPANPKTLRLISGFFLIYFRPFLAYCFSDRVNDDSFTSSRLLRKLRL